MGVYGDSLIETVIALLWQYSLVMLQVQSIQTQLNNNDSDTGLNSFHPHGSALHYRDPAVCNEMLQIVSQWMSNEEGCELLRMAICISLQMDISADQQNEDRSL